MLVEAADSWEEGREQLADMLKTITKWQRAAIVYSITIGMVPDHTAFSAFLVSRKYGIDVILAIIQTESSFNPLHAFRCAGMPGVYCREKM